MSGFTGWIAEAPRQALAPAELEAVASRLSRFRNEPLASLNAPDCGFVASFEAASASLSQQEQSIALIEGYPNWTNPGDGEIADRQGNAAALLELYRRKADLLFDELKGPFALAIVDRAAREAILAIDRFGIHSLSYGMLHDGSLVFSTSLQSLVRYPGVDAELDPQPIFDFFYFVDRIPAPRTVYRHLRKLPPGHFVHLRGGRLCCRPYWQMSYRAQSEYRSEALPRELLDHLRRSVRTSIAGEDPKSLGAFLSGGLDSSTVLGLLREASQTRPKSFTIGFDVEGFDESRYASIAAERFDAQQHTYYLQPDDVLKAIPIVASFYDEPFANSSALPAYFCALQAKSAGVDLLLAGDGGDEIFAGNSRYLYDRVYDVYGSLPSAVRRRLLEPLADRAGWLDRVPLLRRIRSYVRSASLPVAERMWSDNIFAHFEAGEIFAPDFLDLIDRSAPARHAAQIYDGPERASKIQRMMYLDLRLTLADSDLRKVGRMCELAGIRVRFPFLDDDLVAFSGQIPAHVLMKDGTLRGFYKDALKGFLPDEIVKKPKKGFGLPYTALLASYRPLNELACGSLESLKSRTYFRPEFVDRMIAVSRERCPSPVSGLVWDLMVLEQWLQANGSTS